MCACVAVHANNAKPLHFIMCVKYYLFSFTFYSAHSLAVPQYTNASTRRAINAATRLQVETIESEIYK